jgi:hypothetical protein
MITNNDKTLFISTRSTLDNTYSIVKVDLDTETKSIVKDEDGNATNLVDFHPFDAKLDLFITVVARSHGNYYIQLRRISDLVVIDDYRHPFNEITDIRVIGNIEWGFNFAVALPETFDDENIYLFSVDNNKIIQLEGMAKASFSSLYSCSKYMLSHEDFSQIITLYNSNDLSLAGTITSPYGRIESI